MVRSALRVVAYSAGIAVPYFVRVVLDIIRVKVRVRTSSAIRSSLLLPYQLGGPLSCPTPLGSLPSVTSLDCVLAIQCEWALRKGSILNGWGKGCGRGNVMGRAPMACSRPQPFEGGVPYALAYLQAELCLFGLQVGLQVGLCVGIVAKVTCRLGFLLPLA